MPTSFEFAVLFEQKHISEIGPVAQEGWSELQPGDILTIIGKKAPGTTANGIASPADGITPHLGQLSGWPQGYIEGREFINTPPPAAPRGAAMGNFVVRYGDPLPDRGDKITNVVKLVGKIGCELQNGVILSYFQVYSGEF